MKTIKKYFRRSFGFFKQIDCLQKTYNKILCLKNKKKFLAEINRRASIELFDYKSLSEPLPFCPFEKIKDSNYYGYVRALKEYIGVPEAKINIEHGLYFNDTVSYYANYKTFDSIMTFSDYRLDIIKKNGVNKRLLAIGPYIHYAQPLLSENDYRRLKAELGKVLLYMPFHSTILSNGTSPQFGKEVDMVEELKLKYGYDTVVVCVYYRDLQYKDCIKLYKDKGFKVTTAGHQLDLYFVRRLKSIISLANMTVSNRVGTNLGFCVHLGKPHMVINDYPNKYDLTKQGGRVGKELSDLFSEYSEVISEKQYKAVDYYWGLHFVKTKEEIIDFLSNRI